MVASSASHRHVQFQTTDYDRAGQYMTDAYGTGVHPAGSSEGYFFRHTRMEADVLFLDTVEQNREVWFTVEAMAVLMVARPFGTTMDFRPEGTEHRFGPGEVFLVSQDQGGTAYRTGWRDGAVQVAAVPFALLGDLVEPRRGTQIRFRDLRPGSSAAAGHLLATIDYLRGALCDRPQVMSEPLVASAAARLLGATILSTFPSTALTEPTAGDGRDSHSGTLRRAVAFIDDHADQDISVADIAAAANVTIRALQYAFRRWHNTTPTGYLRLVRLRHAHQELLAADPTAGATVTQIAARWGFFHQGRFAQHHREVYGETPYRSLLREVP
ncbi:helix-turn-helix domain-containing protein [Amycolatopsis aidingensis]|uniref:helix-turn-helix domain-containing protein n=1 Tax=Amycolatopsis aidingensis TaxID=2842453 RepID=UPI001C0C6CC6|nr:helix-turn-helix domain-containing protein [Amycolatopsis aidingensis]